MISDWNYLQKARKGDQEALNLLYEKFSKSLLRMTSLITGSVDSAKDVVQETFIRLITKRIKHQDGNFKSFVATIAYRLALKERSRSQRNKHIFSDEHIDSTPSPIEIQIREEQRILLFKTISNLPEQQRDILVLRFYGELSYEKIAETTQLPIGTVKSRIFYAVKECRNILREKGVLNDSY